MIKVLGGIAFCFFGLLLFLVGVYAMIDPKGAKMADDNDPFGEPPKRIKSAFVAIGGCFSGSLGLWLMISPLGKKE